MKPTCSKCCAVIEDGEKVVSVADGAMKNGQFVSTGAPKLYCEICGPWFIEIAQKGDVQFELVDSMEGTIVTGSLPGIEEFLRENGRYAEVPGDLKLFQQMIQSIDVTDGALMKKVLEKSKKPAKS